MRQAFSLCSLLSLLLPVACTEPADPLAVEHERLLCSAGSRLRLPVEVPVEEASYADGRIPFCKRKDAGRSSGELWIE